LEITLKIKCCLYVVITIRFFSITICNLLIDFLSYNIKTTYLPTVYPSLQDNAPHCCKPQSYAPEDGQKIARNMLSWSKDQLKFLLLHLVGHLYYSPTLMMHGQTRVKFANFVLFFSNGGEMGEFFFSNG
jgi:hypothetical protein